ncbi:MAG: hypothetical protein AABY07_10910 [Nanoarchaeota archaeon]
MGRLTETAKKLGRTVASIAHKSGKIGGKIIEASNKLDEKAVSTILSTKRKLRKSKEFIGRNKKKIIGASLGVGLAAVGGKTVVDKVRKKRKVSK